jgi:hypothetical protein
MSWLLLILTLPTENATARMRAWRTLKASGAAVLRDGAYLLPEREACRAILEEVADAVRAAGGSAHLLTVGEPGTAAYPRLFERADAYGELLEGIAGARLELAARGPLETLKTARKLRKAFDGIREIDFFPGEALRQAETALNDLEALLRRALAPDEPHDAPGAIPRLATADYRGRRWATRRRPWVDRLASAWLIRRFIDPEVAFLWLESSADCPADALGFDFDGAAFSHLDGKVTFEILAASFGLDDPALRRVGALVHFLDVGGVQPPEACGVERVLAGLRDLVADDDALLAAASGVFDGLYGAFARETKSP